MDINPLHLIRNLQYVCMKFSCTWLPSFFSRNDSDYLIKGKNQKQYWEVFTSEFIDKLQKFQTKGEHAIDINLLLFTTQAFIILFNACRKNRNDNVQEEVMIFQIIFSNVLNKMKNWFINYVGFTTAYTSNGRQRTAEDDLQEFLSKSPTASRSNEPDRLSSHLLRLFLQSDILLLYTYIQRIHVDRV